MISISAGHLGWDASFLMDPEDFYTSNSHFFSLLTVGRLNP